MSEDMAVVTIVTLLSLTVFAFVGWGVEYTAYKRAMRSWKCSLDRWKGSDKDLLDKAAQAVAAGQKEVRQAIVIQVLKMMGTNATSEDQRVRDWQTGYNEALSEVIRFINEGNKQ